MRKYFFLTWNNVFLIIKVDAVAHYGFPIFEEDKILFKKTTSSERDLQTTALLIAKIFAEFVIFQLFLFSLYKLSY